MKDRQWLVYASSVGGLHCIAIALLFVSVFQHPVLLGMALLAYTFGLRHAFDVDHIAAIDNTVRKLVQERKNPMGVGFFFSLGHSTVVACMTVVTVFAVHFAAHRLPQMENVGGLIGTLVSGTFLLVIGCVNLFICLQIFGLFMQMRRGTDVAQELEQQLHSRGFVTRLVRPLLQLVTKSWHIYPIGFLFGLGFDTASEVALLAISAIAAKNAIPYSGILSLPLLFASGMSLMDTADGIFITNAYDWAFSTPLRKVYYNLSITSLGVLAALLTGGVELMQVLTPKLGLHSGFWSWLQGLDFSAMGYILVALFLVVWAVSVCFWKFFRVEERWSESQSS
ncbi:HoxN/HupN/NixA family nickel/cobalt transporter [Alicyclobacillus fodiniaquatilis]|jgi:high-affinity nickel-transport protein|uniref:Nickel/cobalt efflux system n=1 Tax=Alicyclobacillus fodiniaquatilis TaxID=1661150 RepID=A0ABW4JNM3_9BACL